MNDIPIQIFIEDEVQMLGLGAKLARLLAGQGVLHLNGQLGAGKTTLCRGIIRSMGYSGAVKSPTFTLVEPYSFDGADVGLDCIEVFHFDLYRLADPGELDYIGIDEYFGAGKLCLIEWPEKAHGQLPQHDIEIAIDVCDEKRNIGIKAITPYGEEICEKLLKETI
jgi:tRNA threonylcarbamoyladenosine biosynthesis protein TsaE